LIWIKDGESGECLGSTASFRRESPVSFLETLYLVLTLVAFLGFMASLAAVTVAEARHQAAKG
jgi:hypothetical protein